jgi:hypothetical protein
VLLLSSSPRTDGATRTRCARNSELVRIIATISLLFSNPFVQIIVIGPISHAHNCLNPDGKISHLNHVGSVQFSSFWLSVIRFGSVRFGSVRFGLVWFGLVWFGLVWFGLVRFGTVQFGSVRFGSVLFILVWFGLVWFGLFQFGLFGSFQFSSVQFP